MIDQPSGPRIVDLETGEIGAAIGLAPQESEFSRAVTWTHDGAALVVASSFTGVDVFSVDELTATEQFGVDVDPPDVTKVLRNPWLVSHPTEPIVAVAARGDVLLLDTSRLGADELPIMNRLDLALASFHRSTAAWSEGGELYVPFTDSDLFVIEEGEPKVLAGLPDSDTRVLANPMDDGALLVADYLGDAAVIDLDTGMSVNGPWPAGEAHTFVHGVELRGGDVLALVRDDDTIHLWSRVGGNALSQTLPPVDTNSPSAYYLPGADVVLGSSDTTVWAVGDGMAVAVDFGVEDVRDVALSPTTRGDVAVVVDGAGRASVHELPSGERIGHPIDLGTTEASGRVTEDRRLIVVQVPDGLRVFDFESGRELGSFDHNLTASSYTRVQHGLAAVVVANLTASANFSTTMVVDLEALEVIYRGPGLTSVLLPDRKGFASDAGPAVVPDTGFSLVDIETGDALWSIPGTGIMGGFDPSGRFVVTFDDGIQYHDFDTRQPVGPFVPGSATMARDGAPITQVRDGRIHLWKSDPTAWPAIACQLAGRNLTRAE